MAYSGGKCLRGPQTAGLLLGRKDLVRAAWVHSAPHHGPGRAMKVGKEEAMGMLAAVEMWEKRDHDAEWKQWTAWLDAHREARVGDCRRDDDGHAAGGIVEPHAFAACCGGMRSVSGFPAKPSRARSSRSEPRIALAAGRRPGPPVETGVVGDSLHDVGGRRGGDWRSITRDPHVEKSARCAGSHRRRRR